MKKILYLLLLAVIACKQNTTADYIITNATIYTVDSSFSRVNTLAVKDGKIIAVGNNIGNNFTTDSIVDAAGKFVYPGFIDAHAHFVGYGKGLFEVDVFGCTSFEEVVEKVKAFAAKNPNEPWIIGRGWDQNKFPNKAYPNNNLLNAAFPNKPVLLTRVDGHAAIANAYALQLANVLPNQTLIGGSVETINGKLTGILIDNATDLVSSKMATPTTKDYEKWLLAAQKNCFAAGLTTITDCGLSYKDVEQIDALQQSNLLNMRLYVMLSDANENYDTYLKKGTYKTDKLFVNGFKVYADGALGSRGACLLHPYNDKPTWTGFLLNTYNHYDSIAKLLSTTNFQMCTHAIGDSANRTILNIYQKYLSPNNNKRWRIEHAQVVNEADFSLFGKAAIVPSVQPTHATSDMYWAKERLGEQRLKDAYAFKKLLQQNKWIPLGTDFPVEDISPFKTFLAAVFRVDAQQFPQNGFQLENGLSREETLRGMTIWAAKAGFLEQEVGSLEVGKKADFIMLDTDLMKVAANKVLQTKVLATYVGGKKVY
jgi:predicted amidohydrolase YtcJ